MQHGMLLVYSFSFSKCPTIVAEIQINSFINSDLGTNHDHPFHLLPHKGRRSHPFQLGLYIL